jgi:hypothetical protein
MLGWLGLVTAGIEAYHYGFVTGRREDLTAGRQNPQ